MNRTFKDFVEVKLATEKFDKHLNIYLPAGMNMQLSEPISLTTSAPFDAFKSTRATLAPSRTNLSTVALPNPEAPPVTNPTTFLSIFF